MPQSKACLASFPTGDGRMIATMSTDGLQTASDVPPAKMMMDPQRLLIAVRRGAATSIDLRERHNILPESVFEPRSAD